MSAIRAERAGNRTRTLVLAFVAVAFAALGYASPAWAAPGDLDRFFSGDGKLTTDFFDADEGEAVAVQSDGKIVVAGTSEDGADSNFAIARYNPDGSRDTSFDGDGRAVVRRTFATCTSCAPDEVASDLAIQSDGKIVVVGTTTDVFESDDPDVFFVARLNPNGSLDTSFSDDGMVDTRMTPHGGTANDRANAVAIQSDGKIVVAGKAEGHVTSNDFAVARYNSSGSLDTSFDGDGKVVLDGFFGSIDEHTDVAIQSDGKIVAAGNQGFEDFNVMRYNSNGSLDTTFSSDGRVQTDFKSRADVASSLAVQSNGKIVVAGRADTCTSSCPADAFNDDFALARYNPNGSLDTTFSSDGKATTGFGNLFEMALDVAVEGGGKIVAAGLAGGNFTLARYTSGGALDTAFSGDGRTATDFGATDEANGVVIQSDGRIVAAGKTGNADFAVARYFGGSDLTTPPETSILRTGTGALAWTRSTTATFSFTANEATSGYECSLDSTTSFSACASPRIYSFVTPNTSHTFRVKATDISGNTDSTPAQHTWTVDTIAPDTTITGGPNGPTNDNTPTFTYSGSDNLTPTTGLTGLRYSFKVDNGSWSQFSGGTSATVGGSTGLGEGNHTFYVKALDRAGNEDASPAQRSFTVDTTAPDPPVINDPPEGSYDTDGNLTLSGTAEAGSTVKLFEGLDAKGTATADASGNWSVTAGGVTEGSHTYTARATDAADNTSETSNSRTVIVDTTAPTVLTVAPAEGATGVGLAVNVRATFSEEMDPATIDVTTFTLVKLNGDGTTTAVSGTVTYDAVNKRAILNPDADLEPGARYRARVTTVVKDVAGNALDQNPDAEGNQPKVWTFTVRT
jgi:uncharacterized delta-60 repeat protein